MVVRACLAMLVNGGQLSLSRVEKLVIIMDRFILATAYGAIFGFTLPAGFAAGTDGGTSRLSMRVYEDPAAFSWQGFYVGGHGGLAFRNLRGNVSGLTGGLQAGYNLQFGAAVLGVEVEGSHLGGPNGTFGSNRVEESWRIAEKGRFGLIIDRTLLYAVGGYATTRISGPKGAPAADGWKGGILAGGGIEQGFADGLSAKIEYNYIITGGPRMISPVGQMIRFDSGHIVKAGLNHRF